MPAPRLTNAMTIDVEDYFQVSAFAPYINRTEWDSRECRVERNIHAILEMLAAQDTHATFFTLGWIAERYPQLVRHIVDNGHELASHGYAHQRASEQTPEVFFDDIDRAKKMLEDLSGQEIQGYRAPSFSIGKGNLWAYDTLLEAGYRYSSSIYPIAHDHYGMPDSPRFAYEVRPGLTEIPITTVRLLKRNFPSSGGGYFRLLPYPVSRWLLQHVNTHDQQPGIFYFHPWEIDPGQPRIAGINRKTRFRHYVNIGQTQARLNRLLADFKWGRVDHLYMNQGVPVPLTA
jgi:polysaccharide deacetylase family protein (PEP-CTERM system associated)